MTRGNGVMVGWTGVLDVFSFLIITSKRGRRLPGRSTSRLPWTPRTSIVTLSGDLPCVFLTESGDMSTE